MGHSSEAYISNKHLPNFVLTEALQPPLAPAVPKIVEAHGDSREDPYYWLRDDQRNSKKVLEHLSAENAYTKAVLGDTVSLQDTLYKEMRGRIQEADESVPVRCECFSVVSLMG